MDGCLVQNKINTFSEARYHLNKNRQDNYCSFGIRNFIARQARTGGNKSSAYNAIVVHWNQTPTGCAFH